MEKENTQPKKLVANQAPDIAMLKEIAQANSLRRYSPTRKIEAPDSLVRAGTTIADVAAFCLALLGFATLFSLSAALLFRCER